MCRLYRKALSQVADKMQAQLAMIERHKADIDRIDNLAFQLRSHGISAEAGLDAQMSLYIRANGDTAAIDEAINATGHRVIRFDHAQAYAMINPPDGRAYENGLPASLIIEDNPRN